MGIGDYVGSSFNYAKEALVGKWVRWILLLICTVIQFCTISIIPLMSGYLVRVLEGSESAPDVNKWGKLFVDGWKINIIAIVYFIIPVLIGLIILILAEGFSILTLILENVMNPMAFLGLIAGVAFTSFIVFIIFAIIFGFFQIIGMVKFARSGKLGAAFSFSEIVAHIGKIGWGKYIVSLIVLWIILAIISAILYMIPIVGWIILAIIAPLFAIWEFRLFSQLYDAGV